MNIPGQRRLPYKSNAAKARPVGGQTAEALGLMKARAKPNFPAPK